MSFSLKTLSFQIKVSKIALMVIEDFDDKFYVILNGVVSVQNASGLFGSGSLAGRSQMSASGIMWSSQMMRMSQGN